MDAADREADRRRKRIEALRHTTLSYTGTRVESFIAPFRRRITIPGAADPIPMRSIAADGLTTCGMMSLAILTIHRRLSLALLQELPLEQPSEIC